MNQKIETFSFAELVAKFDQARVANPTSTQWSLMNGLLDAHLNSSNTAAIGGELAYDYGRNDSFAATGVVATQAILKDPGFGSAQILKPFQGLHGDVAISH